MRRRVHHRNVRLFVNAGMPFPTCQVPQDGGLLDTDKSRWITRGQRDEVTCKRCLKILKDGEGR